MWNSQPHAHNHRDITAYIHIYIYTYPIKYCRDRDKHTDKPNPGQEALQWVHGLITVVMRQIDPLSNARHGSFNGSTV